MAIDWDKLDELDITERERLAVSSFMDYIDEFSANEYLRGRAKGKLRELFSEVIESFYDATAPMERVDVALDAETLRLTQEIHAMHSEALRLTREIHAMVSECSGHIGRMANPADTASLVPVVSESTTEGEA